MKTAITFLLLLTSFIANAQQWSWAKQLGGMYYAKMDEDVNGNIYTAVQQTYNTTRDTILFSKMDSMGNVAWQRSIACVCADLKVSDGGIYISGYFRVNLVLDSYSFNAQQLYDGFLAAFDLNGNVKWVKHFTGNNNTYVGSICPKSDGLFVCGRHDSTDIFVHEYDTVGNFLSNFSINTLFGSAGIVLDKNENIYMVGSYADSALTVGGITFTSSDAYHGAYFMAKLHNTGIAYWAKDFGSLYRREITYPAVNDSGQIYYARGHDYSGSELVKMDENGLLIWSKPIGSGTYGGVSQIKIDENGDLYLTGNCWVHGQYGQCTINGAQGFLTFAKLDSDGNCKWILKGQGTDGSISSFVSIKNTHPLILGLVKSPTIQLGQLSVQGMMFLAKVDENAIAGTEHLSQVEFNRLYPNPSTGKFVIENAEEITSISVTNAFGQRVHHLEPHSLKTELDFGTLPKGVYFIEVNGLNSREVRKIIMQ